MKSTFNEIRKAYSAHAPEKAEQLEIVGRMKGIREREGISQQELSRRSGVPEKTISFIESGKISPNAETLSKLATTLGIETKRTEN